MSASSRLYFEIFESGMEKHDEIKEDYYDSLYLAKKDPRWAACLGKAMTFVYQVLMEQSSTDESAFEMYQQSQLFAVRCIARDEEPTLKRAYQSMGYEMGKEELAKPIIELPF
tara:strand:+ start:243 stop:581 length:339 start_codon:yes stop_codon:yes gene_type:complete